MIMWSKKELETGRKMIEKVRNNEDFSDESKEYFEGLLQSILDSMKNLSVIKLIANGGHMPDDIKEGLGLDVMRIFMLGALCNEDAGSELIKRYKFEK